MFGSATALLCCLDLAASVVPLQLAINSRQATTTLSLHMLVDARALLRAKRELKWHLM